jgi:hypothetical protein
MDMFFKRITMILVCFALTGCVSNESSNPSSLDSDKNALALSYIERLRSCPSSVHTGMYLDGGTIGVKAKYDKSEMLYFGLEYLEKIQINEWRKRSAERSDKHAKAFLGKHPNDKSFSLLLPYNGQEENALRGVLHKWFECNDLDDNSKSAIQEYIDQLNKPRVRPVEYLLDKGNLEQAKWQNEHSRKGIFGPDVEDAYLIIQGESETGVKITQGVRCVGTAKCDGQWYKYKIKVHSEVSNSLAEGSIVYAIQNKPYQPASINPSSFVVISEIPNLEEQKLLGAKYYIHEVSTQPKIVCFGLELPHMEKFKASSATLRFYGEKEQYCLNIEG